MPFQGIEDFVAAVTGRNALQAQGYNTGIDRLTKQRSAQALLDDRIARAALSRDINRSRGSAIGLIEDPLLAAISGANPGFGSNLLAGTRAEGVGQQNDARAQALDAITKAVGGGNEIPADLLNALSQIYSGGKFGPGNVQVQDQAESDIRASDATAALNEAKLNQKFPLDLEAVQALINTRTARTSQINNPATRKPINLENPSIEQMALLFGPETEEPGMFFGTNTVKGKDLFPEFEKFRAERALAGEDMSDSGIAIQKFLASKAAPAVAGQSATPVSPTAPVIPAQVAPEDVDAFIQEANRLISQGADPEAVKQRLKDMGISVQ